MVNIMNGVDCTMRKSLLVLTATALFAVLLSHQSHAGMQYVVAHASITPILFVDGADYKEITCQFTKGGKSAGADASFFSQQELTPEEAQEACLEFLQTNSK
jgi:hypothetical protein